MLGPVNERTVLTLCVYWFIRLNGFEASTHSLEVGRLSSFVSPNCPLFVKARVGEVSLFLSIR